MHPAKLATVFSEGGVGYLLAKYIAIVTLNYHCLRRAPLIRFLDRHAKTNTLPVFLISPIVRVAFVRVHRSFQ